MYELPSGIGSMATACGCIIGQQEGLPDIVPAQKIVAATQGVCGRSRYPAVFVRQIGSGEHSVPFSRQPKRVGIPFAPNIESLFHRRSPIAKSWISAKFQALPFHSCRCASPALLMSSWLPLSAGHYHQITCLSNSISGGNATVVQLIKVREVCRLTTLSRVSIWRRERSGDFPRRVRLGRNSVAWDLGEVLAWIEGLRAYRDATATTPQGGKNA